MKFFAVVFALAVGICAQGVDSLRWRAARALEAQQKWEEAIGEYRAILLNDPSQVDAYLGIGAIRLRQGNGAHALRNYQQALQIDTASIVALEGSARSHTRMGEKEKAIGVWRRIAKSSPDNAVRAERQIADLLGTAVATPSSPPAAPAPRTGTTPSATGGHSYDGPLFTRALEEQQKGDCQGALSTVRKLLQAQAGHPGAYYIGGVCRYNLGEMEKADFNFRRAFDYPEKGHNAHYYLGRIAERRNRKREALEHYNEYLRLTPSSEGRAEAEGRIKALQADGAAAPVPANTAESSENKGSSQGTHSSNSVSVQLPDVLDTLEGALVLAVHRRSAAGGNELRKALDDAKEKRYNQAIESFKQVRLRYPNTGNAQAAALNLIVLYNHLALHDNARNLAVAVLRGEAQPPYRNAVHWQHARVLTDLQDWAAARNALDSVAADVELGPTRAAFLGLAAVIASANKDAKDAHLLMRQAADAEVQPAKKAQLLLRLADYHKSKGEKALAIRVWQEILDACTEAGDGCRQAGYALADINYQGRNWAASLSYYERMVREYPEGEDTPWGIYQQGNIHRRQGRWKESVVFFDQLMERFPDTYWADQAKWSKEDAVWQERHGRLLQGKN